MNEIIIISKKGSIASFQVLEEYNSPPIAAKKTSIVFKRNQNAHSVVIIDTFN